jgi:chemotaxis protein histidine kinase CheA
MPTPLGPTDFFALEAGEYLERLARLAAVDGGPPADEFVRYARALRGSALMANQPEITRAAGALEGVARAYHERAREWDATLAEVVGQSVDDLKRLVRRAREWTADDTARADRLSRALEGISGRAPEGSRPHTRTRGELNAGVRAFVAREGALVASALDRAARALEAEPLSRDPLHNILRRMQSLRGLAALTDLAPLPELLDSLELAVGELLRAHAPPDGVSEVFDAAAKALTRASRDVADAGRPEADAPESRHFAALLIRRLADDRDIVGIETLCPEGQPSIVKAGTPPEQPTAVALGAVELLTHGEFLVHAAEELERAESGTQRDLRLFNLTGALDSPRLTAAPSIGHGLDTFGRAVRLAIVSGTAAGDPLGFAAALRAAGTLIRELGPRSDPERASTELAGLAAMLGQAPDDIVPIESLAPDEDIVPVEQILEEEVEAGAPPAEAVEDSSLAGSFLTFARLSGARARTSGNGGAARTSAPSAPPPAPVAEDEEVEITTLLYRGEAALRRADHVRRDLAGLLRAGAGLASIRPLLDELLDLVPLALEHPA